MKIQICNGGSIDLAKSATSFNLFDQAIISSSSDQFEFKDLEIDLSNNLKVSSIKSATVALLQDINVISDSIALEDTSFTGDHIFTISSNSIKVNQGVELAKVKFERATDEDFDFKIVILQEPSIHTISVDLPKN